MNRMRIIIKKSQSTDSSRQGKAQYKVRLSFLNFGFLLTALGLSFGLVACTQTSSAPDTELRILLSEKAKTLNPRQALDATGQRVGALLFRGLTPIDSDLSPQPDLADRWKVEDQGKAWRFQIGQGQLDQASQPITAQLIQQCLENYRIGKPISPHASAFPNWISTQAQGSEVVLRFSKSDPYLARNISLLRYFRETGSSTPCSEPNQINSIVGSGAYRMEPWDVTPNGDFSLVGPDSKKIRMLFVRDDTTLALRLLRGDVHVTQNALSLAKTTWVKKNYSDRYAIAEREGVNVSYLYFNLRDPILANRDVRWAIAHAIPRDEIVTNKLFGYCQRADSFLLPSLAESHPVQIAYNPLLSEKLLDQAGFPRPANGGPRLRLSFKTQPYRDSVETALIFQEVLKKIGIELKVEVVEPAAILSAVNQGRFQISHSRWTGIADGSILFRTLHSKQRNNRARFNDPEVDAWLDQAMGEFDDSRRARLLAQVQIRMMRELPYLPLWYWNNTVIARKDLQSQLSETKISLSGGLEPLVGLKLK